MSKRPTLTADDYRAQQLKALHDMEALKSPNELIEACDVPADIAIALLTRRSELMKLTAPRPMTADEVAAFYKFVAVLIETNYALQMHAKEVSNMAEQLVGNMRGIISYGLKLERFADFEHSGSDEDDSDY